MEALVKRGAPAGGSESEQDENNQINTRFHILLAEMTENRKLVELLTSILEQLERLMYVEFHRFRFPVGGWRLRHAPISEAIRRRDPAAARTAVLRDISDAWNFAFGTVNLESLFAHNDGPATDSNSRKKNV